MGALHEFQDTCARALLARPGEEPEAARALAAQPGFAVYRNTVMKGCIDALQANYPAVARLVGEDWFRAAAAVYVRAHLPRTPMLIEYGADFGGFLDGFEPARDLSYLGGVARLERCWTESHVAHDEPAADTAALAALAPEALAALSLRPHASARWAWFDAQPIVTLWRRNRAGDADLSDVAWRGEGVLIVRPREAVKNVELDRAGCAFLDACRAGRTLADAAQAALAADANVDIARLMAQLLRAGAFAADSDIVKTDREEA